MNVRKPEYVPNYIFSKILTFICDYPMHCYIEQPGSEGGVGMWRGYRWTLLSRLSLVVFDNIDRKPPFHT